MQYYAFDHVFNDFSSEASDLALLNEVFGKAEAPYKIDVCQISDCLGACTGEYIEKLIDNKSVISKYDRNTILREFITTNIAGNITLNSVHFEILLMNQIRSLDDDLESPDWTDPNATYQIMALSKSLNNNNSSLNFEK